MQQSFQRVTQRVSLVLATSTAIAVATPAFSMDAVSFFKAIQADVKKDGNTMTFQSLDATGDDGAKATGIVIIDGEKGEHLTIGEMTLTGTKVLGEDAFSFETMNASDITFITTREGDSTSTLRISKANATDFEVLPDEARSKPFWPLSMAAGRLEQVQVVATGDGNFSLNIPSVDLSGLKHLGGTDYNIDDFNVSASTGSFAAESGANGSLAMGAHSFADVGQMGESGYRLGKVNIGKISFAGVDEKERAVVFEFEGATATDIFSPDWLSTEELIFPEKEALATISSMTLSLDGKEILSMAGGESRAAFIADSGVYGANATIDDITFDIKALPAEPSNEQFIKQFEELGYEKVTMDLTLEGGWNTISGLLDVSSYKFDLQDMGALDLSMKLGGYTVDFVRQLQKIGNRMNATTDKDVQQALSMQVLAQMSALTVEDMKIDLQDKSLTRRVMDAQAGKSGQTSEEMAAALPFMAGAMLSQLNIPDFAASVSSAVGAFLNSALSNKGRITLSAKPEEPISLAEIMGIAGGVQAGNVQPQEIVDRLNLQIVGE